MRKSFLRFVIIAGVATVLSSFFIPWVRVDLDMAKPVGKISRGIDRVTGTDFFSNAFLAINQSAGDAAGTRKTLSLSAFQIARSGQTKIAGIFGDFMTLFGKNQDPRKSALLFLIPLAALALGALSFWGVRRSAVLLSLASLAHLVLGVFMGVKLLGISFQSDFAEVALLLGGPLSCLSFIAMGYFGLTRGRFKL